MNNTFANLMVILGMKRSVFLETTNSCIGEGIVFNQEPVIECFNYG